MCIHLDFDTEHTLLEQDVTDSVVNVLARRLARVNHETVGEFHRLRTSRTELARYNDFATLCARLHNEAQHTIACATNSEATEKLVAQRLALRDSRETTELDLLSVQLERVLRELETLLDERSEFADTAALITKDLLGVGGTNDDLCIVL